MGDEEMVISKGLVITRETVSTRTFTSAFRGYHPVEVRQFLKRVGDELAAGAGRESELRRALQEALNRAAHPDLDEATVTNVLGEHAARLLATARETAANIAEAGQRQADAMVRDAEVRVARMRDEAEGLLARRLAEAEAATASVHQEAEADVRAVTDKARAEADAAVEQAKQQGRDMLAEAKAVRERILGDLTRRRRAVQVEIEQLRAARDRLLAAYDVVRRTAEEATAELVAAEPEARQAAEAVGRLAAEEDRRAAGAEAATADPWAPLLGDPLPEPAPVEDRVPVPAAHAMAQERAAPSSLSRPPLRPQTVADAVARRPLEATAAVDPPSELATMENPIISVGGAEAQPVTHRHGNGNGNGNGNGTSVAAPEQRVDALFARIRADRAQPEPAPVDPEPAVEPAAPSPAEILGPIAAENTLSRRDELLENVEAGLTRALKRVLQDEQNEVLDSLRRRGGPGAAAAAVLPDGAAQQVVYRDAALPWLQQAAVAGVNFASDPPPGSDVEHAYPPLDSDADTLGRELVAPLRERLARALEDADDPSVLAESVRAAYRRWKVQHVEETARHHVLAAFALGAFSATADAAPLQWVVDDDGHCPDCDDNALAGPTTKGEPFPTGQLHPPAHPGCRCLIVAVPT